MNMLLLLSTWLVALLAVPPAEVPPHGAVVAAAPEGVDVVLHPLHDIVPLLEHTQAFVPLLPLSVGFEDEGDYEHDDGLAFVEEIIRHAIPDEFDYEGRSLGVHGDGVLAVRAPQAVQARVAALLDGLRSAFRRRADVTVRVFDVLDPARLGADPSAADLDALVEAGALRLAFQRRQDVPMGSTVSMSGASMRSYCLGWDGSIAQGTSLVEPLFGQVRDGVDVLVRVEDDGEAQALRMVARRTALRVLERREVALRRTTRLADKVLEQSAVGVLELPVLGTSLVTGSARMLPGEHLLHVLWTLTEHGLAGCVVDVRLGDVAARTDAPLAVAGNSVLLRDLARAVWGSPATTRPSLDWLVPFADGHVPLHRARSSWPRIVFPSEDFDWSVSAREDLESVLHREDVTLLECGSWLALVGRTEAVDRLLGGLPLPASPRHGVSLQLGVTESRPPSAGAERGGLRLALETGTTAYALVGDARGIMAGASVDVATDRAQSVPSQADLFDGLVLRATALERDVRVELALARLDEMERIDVTDVVGLVFDRPVLTLGEADARVPMDGARHVVAVIPSGESILTVWAAATRE